MIEFKIISTADKSQQSNYQHIGRELTIGSADAEMIIDDPQLAPTQIRIFCEGNQYFIENLVPELEVRLNGKSFEGRAPLKARDNLTMARTTINFSTLNIDASPFPPKFEHPHAESRFAPGTHEQAILDALEYLAAAEGGAKVATPPPPKSMPPPPVSAKPPLPPKPGSMPPPPPRPKKDS